MVIPICDLQIRPIKENLGLGEFLGTRGLQVERQNARSANMDLKSIVAVDHGLNQSTTTRVFFNVLDGAQYNLCNLREPEETSL